MGDLYEQVYSPIGRFSKEEHTLMTRPMENKTNVQNITSDMILIPFL